MVPIVSYFQYCKNCPKECNGEVISSLEVLADFEGCTKITGDLTIQISGENVVHELKKYLGKVQIITGSLKISRSFPIISLDFFQSLKEIQVNQQDPIYSIESIITNWLYRVSTPRTQFPKTTIRCRSFTTKIFRDCSLNPPTSRSTRGMARMEMPSLEGNTTIVVLSSTKFLIFMAPNRFRGFIHYNAKLCPSEIKKLLQSAAMHDPGSLSTDISYATNGGKAVCSSTKLNLTVETVGYRLKLVFDNYQEQIVAADATNDYRYVPCLITLSLLWSDDCLFTGACWAMPSTTGRSTSLPSMGRI